MRQKTPNLTVPYYERPCAAPGFISYRYRSRYGFVMIGARNTAEALREASRSISPVQPSADQLEVWNGRTYVAAEVGE